MPEPIEQNIWEHFKGGLYKVLFLAQDSETEEPVVVYVALKNGTTWTRKQSAWVEMVKWPDGVMRPRFCPCVPVKAAPEAETPS